MAKVKQAVKQTGRAHKELIVAEIVEKLDTSKGLVFADYQGLTHKQLEDLKRELKKLDSTIIVTKNSLLKLSLGQSKNYADYKDNEGLNLPTAALFMNGDIVEPLKKLQKVVKELGLPKIKFGILDGQLVDEGSVLKIASLPSRDVLLGQFVGMLNSPITGLVMTLNGNIQKFVMTLGAIAQAKPATPVAPEPASPPATEEPVVAAEAAPEPTVVEPASDQAEVVAEVEAAPASEPAVQPDSPVESGETPESQETNEKTDDDKGGEN